MDNLLEREERDWKKVFLRFRKRDFSGNTGQAIKNSSYQLATNIAMKVGSLLFTIIVARLLLPEKMGLYSLALSTIILFAAFSDFGISTALLTFISKTAGRGNQKKAKAYLEKLLKWKVYVVLGASALLLSLSYFIANNYYNKPIFYALLAGGLYIPLVAFTGFFEQILRSLNNFKIPFIKELIFQLLRLTIVPVAIIFLLRDSFSNEFIVVGVIFSLILCYAVSFLFILFSAKKDVSFIKTKSFSSLSTKETKSLKKFIFPLSFVVLSGVFFGYIDTLMLGHFVSESYIAYYGAAFALVGSAIAIIGFTSAALFPLFSKLRGSSLEKLFKKSRNFTFLISLLAGIFTYFLAYYVVRIAYGVEYLTSVTILKYFALILLIIPLSGLYNSYFISQKRTNLIAGLLIFSTILNIILNYVGITYGLRFSEFHAVLGATFATITSRGVYLLGLLIARKRK